MPLEMVLWYCVWWNMCCQCSCCLYSIPSLFFRTLSFDTKLFYWIFFTTLCIFIFFCLKKIKNPVALFFLVLLLLPFLHLILVWNDFNIDCTYFYWNVNSVFIFISFTAKVKKLSNIENVVGTYILYLLYLLIFPLSFFLTLNCFSWSFVGFVSRELFISKNLLLYLFICLFVSKMLEIK